MVALHCNRNKTAHGKLSGLMRNDAMEGANFKINPVVSTALTDMPSATVVAKTWVYDKIASFTNCSAT